MENLSQMIDTMSISLGRGVLVSEFIVDEMPSEVKNLTMFGRRTCQHIDLIHIKGIIMLQFADCNMKVSNVCGFTERKKGSVGNKKTLGRTVWRIRTFMVSKWWREIE